MEYDYHLQKYAGTASRHTCPHCGGKRCFTLYVDADNKPLHETVGRSDHESGCGYHYTPGQYFKDHPEARPAGALAPRPRVQGLDERGGGRCVW